MPKKRELPDYKRPPVTEVAVSIQFARLQGLTAAHIGLYWAKIKDAFPNVMEQPPIVHMVENPEAEYKFEPFLSQMPDLPRIWFTDKTGTALIQVQRDRFVYNWRRVKDSDEYIRFPAIKKKFLLRWGEFSSFLKEQGISDPQVDQCELTYVNRIDQGELWESPAKWGNLGRWLSDSAWVSIDDQPPKNIHANKFGKWEWEKIGKPLQLDRGKHLLTLRANRGGFAIDRIVLSAAPYFTPGRLEK